MDLKEPGNCLYLVGLTRDELGGSHFALVEALAGGQVPQVDAPTAKRTFAAVHRAIDAGLVRACHDLSEGGLAVAAAEMAFAGGLGRRSRSGQSALRPTTAMPNSAVLLFSESNTRFLCEVRAGGRRRGSRPRWPACPLARGSAGSTDDEPDRRSTTGAAPVDRSRDGRPERSLAEAAAMVDTE